MSVFKNTFIIGKQLDSKFACGRNYDRVCRVTVKRFRKLSGLYGYVRCKWRDPNSGFFEGSIKPLLDRLMQV